MSAVVQGINRRRGVVAARDEDGGYIVFELLGPDDVDLGDVLSRIPRSHGGATIRNSSRGCDLSVFIEAIDATAESARQLLD